MDGWPLLYYYYTTLWPMTVLYEALKIRSIIDFVYLDKYLILYDKWWHHDYIVMIGKIYL